MKLHSLTLTSWLALSLGILAGLSSCDKRPTPIANDALIASETATTSSARSGYVTDDWIGQWNGPEGTFLRIGGQEGNYVISIQNLDGLSQYQGRSVDNQIQFERDGVTETIRATKGEETGMKWLMDKANCLTVHAGEGYCKD